MDEEPNSTENPDEQPAHRDTEPVTFDAVMRACGSSSHHPDELLTPPELSETLAEVHPVVVATFVRRWAQARDELGGSSAEHPDFREALETLLDTYPDGYSVE